MEHLSRDTRLLPLAAGSHIGASLPCTPKPPKVTPCHHTDPSPVPHRVLPAAVVSLVLMALLVPR